MRKLILTFNDILNWILIYLKNFRCLKSAGGYDDWPNGRGIFMNKDKNFIVWVNEEDHIRIISMQKGANLKEVWGRLVTVSFNYNIKNVLYNS